MPGDRNAETLAAILALNGGSFDTSHPNYLAVTSDLSSATWNTVAAHEILTVTGVCRIRLLGEITVTGDDTSGTTSTIIVGVAGSTSFLAGSGTPDVVDTLIAGQLFEFDSAPASAAQMVPATAIIDFVANGVDVGYTIAGEAATAGTIVWHCWWEPLNATGAVAAGAGGTFA